MINFGPTTKGAGGRISTSFCPTDRPDIVCHVSPPLGCGMLIGYELSQDQRIRHKHTGNQQRSLSFIVDLRVKDDVPKPPTEQALADAAAEHARNPVDFDTFPWVWKEFQGRRRKWGQTGGGSVRRCVVAELAGPQTGGRGSRRPRMPLKEAREKERAMSEAERKQLAAGPIDWQFVQLAPTSEAGGPPLRAYVSADTWRTLPERRRDFETTGGASAKGASASTLALAPLVFCTHRLRTACHADHVGTRHWHTRDPYVGTDHGR